MNKIVQNLLRIVICYLTMNIKFSKTKIKICRKTVKHDFLLKHVNILMIDITNHLVTFQIRIICQISKCYTVYIFHDDIKKH